MDINVINETKEKMDKTLESLDNRFTTVRAGRANPSMLDDVFVEAYGSKMPLKQVATIFVPEARQISVKPFDKTLLCAIEKAIYEANLGLAPNNNGESVFLTIPPLTEERRKELVKQVKEYAEEGRIRIRNIRKDIIDDIKNDELPEDEERNIVDKLQEVVNDYNKKVEDLTKEKEQDLMEI